MHGVQPAAKAIPNAAEPKKPRGLSSGEEACVFVKCGDLEQADQLQTKSDDDDTADDSHPWIARDRGADQSRSCAEHKKDD